MITYALIHAAILLGWLLVLPALAILEMCRGLASIPRQM